MTYINSNTILTANNVEQIRSVVWKEIKDILPKVFHRHPWLSAYFIIETKRFYAKGYKDQWFVMPRTAPTHKPEGMAGMHRPWLTYLVDEASGYSDAVMNVIEGALTDDRNRLMMMSQGTRPIGRFAEAFGKFKELYSSFRLNSELSPLVKKKFIRECLIKYGGHHSPEYAIRVLGLHPDNLSGYLLPATWIRDCQEIEVTHLSAWGWVLLCDVSDGVGRDSSIILYAKVSGYDAERVVECVYYEEFQNVDPKKFGKMIWQRSLDLPNCTITIDGDGPGRATYLEIEEFGGSVQTIHWGRPCHSIARKKRYQDQRAFSCLRTRNAVLQERIKLPDGEKVVEQASKIPYKYDDKGRYVILSKQKMQSEGIPSPDIFDCICFTQLTDYIPADEALSTEADSAAREAAIRLLQADLGINEDLEMLGNEE